MHVKTPAVGSMGNENQYNDAAILSHEVLLLIFLLAVGSWQMIGTLAN
jgi:hypothetical protein